MDCCKQFFPIVVDVARAVKCVNIFFADGSSFLLMIPVGWACFAIDQSHEYVFVECFSCLWAGHGAARSYVFSIFIAASL
jgi:hypothetical protein